MSHASMAESDDVLVWMDLEMSGLDPECERILEIAVIITDGQLEELAEGPELILHQPDTLLAAMDAWNTRQHRGSGLVDKVRASSVTEKAAETEIVNFLQQFCGPRLAPLAGNSVHQDRRFLKRYMPELEGYLHYRNVDVSTVKELVRRWYPSVYKQKPHKACAHRALDDIRESIEELKYYRQRVFTSIPMEASAAVDGAAPEVQHAAGSQTPRAASA